MATYVNDLRLKEITTGDESGTWGTSTNTNLELIAEAFSFGTEAITTNADTHTTTIADGSTDPGRSIYLKYTGTLDSACTITIGPNTVSKLWFIENGTSGSQNIIISQGSGANVTIPAGHVKAIYSDGAGSGAAMVDAFTDLNLAGTTTTSSLNVSSDLDVDGTANLDVVDIDGAVDMASTLTVGGNVSITAGALSITADGSNAATFTESGAGTLEITTSDDFRIDAAGDITLDADGGDVRFKDDATTIGTISYTSSNLEIASNVSDKDIKLIGNDGGSTITALHLDMSDAGSAYFNNKVGIATSSPEEALHVSGNMVLDDADPRIFFQTGSSHYNWKVSAQDSVNKGFEISSGEVDADANSDSYTARLVIEADTGQVGLGTTSPGQTLDVAGNITADSFIGRSNISVPTGDASVFRVADNTLAFATSSTERMRIDSSGNVGINTTTAKEKLDVSGAGVFTGNHATGTNAYGAAQGVMIHASSSTGFVTAVSNGSNDVDLQLRGLNGGTANSNQLVLDSEGSVGLGTASPSFSAGTGLEISRAGAATLRVTDSDGTTGSTELVQVDADGYLLTRQSGSLILGTNDTERARIDASGLFGIGTSSPSSYNSNGDNLVVAGSGNTGITIAAGTTDDTNIFFADGTSGDAAYRGIIRYNHSDDNFEFYTAATERMHIDSAGVGIGTSSPAKLLHIKSANPVIRLEDSSPSAYAEIDGAGGDLIISCDAGDDDSDSVINFKVDNSERMRINASGRVGIGETDPDNLLHLKSSDDTLLKLESTDAIARLALTDNSGTSQIKNTGGTLILEADPSDATSSTYLGFEVDGTERARILSGGHFLMGTTTNQGVGGISFQETVTGVNIQQNMDGTSGGAELYVFRRNSTQIGSINQSSTNAVTYNTSSDARLKDVTGSSRGLDVINNLNPVAYNWKADNHADEGLIAQEVEELVPNAVNQDEDGYYSMDYSKLVTHLVKGMQEQQEQIESLKSEIANLKGE